MRACARTGIKGLDKSSRMDFHVAFVLASSVSTGERSNSFDATNSAKIRLCRSEASARIFGMESDVEEESCEGGVSEMDRSNWDSNISGRWLILSSAGINSPSRWTCFDSPRISLEVRTSNIPKEKLRRSVVLIYGVSINSLIRLHIWIGFVNTVAPSWSHIKVNRWISVKYSEALLSVSECPRVDIDDDFSTMLDKIWMKKSPAMCGEWGIKEGSSANIPWASSKWTCEDDCTKGMVSLDEKWDSAATIEIFLFSSHSRRRFRWWKSLGSKNIIKVVAELSRDDSRKYRSSIFWVRWQIRAPFLRAYI